MKRSELNALIDQEIGKAVKTIVQKAKAKQQPTLVMVNKAGNAIGSSDLEPVKAQKAREERSQQLQMAIKAALGGKPAFVKPTLEQIRAAGGSSILAAIRAGRQNRS